MVAAARLICASDALVDAGQGVRFRVRTAGGAAEAFAIRHAGRVHAYLNACGHVPAQLDWLPGEFFDDSKLYLICSVHGALYSPSTGACLSGRCAGKGLQPLPVCELDGLVYLERDEIDG